MDEELEENIQKFIEKTPLGKARTKFLQVIVTDLLFIWSSKEISSLEINCWCYGYIVILLVSIHIYLKIEYRHVFPW